MELHVPDISGGPPHTALINNGLAVEPLLDMDLLSGGKRLSKYLNKYDGVGGELVSRTLCCLDEKYELLCADHKFPGHAKGSQVLTNMWNFADACKYIIANSPVLICGEIDL